MHTNDWDAIVLVAQWLKSFRSATTQLLTRKHNQCSHKHKPFIEVFKNHYVESLRNLPKNTLPQLKLGLLRAHRKLSNYYNEIDNSPSYIWVGIYKFFSRILLEWSGNEINKLAGD